MSKIKKVTIAISILFLLILTLIIYTNLTSLYRNMAILKLVYNKKIRVNELKSLKQDRDGNTYFLERESKIKIEKNFILLREGDKFSDLYLETLKIEKISNNGYKLVSTKSKVDIPTQKNKKPTTLTKNDIDSIKYKIDKLNSDFYLEMERLKAKFEKNSLETVMKINTFLKKSELPSDVKSQIGVVFNDNINLFYVSDLLIELIDKLKKNENYNGYKKELKNLTNIYNSCIKLDKNKLDKNETFNLYDLITKDQKIYFDELELVTIEKYIEKVTLF